jgi:hypothetical protein
MINKQRHKTSCGPVAMLNALKWKGYDDNYDDIMRFSKRHLRFKHKGMLYYTVERGLKKLGVKHKLIYKITLPRIVRELNKGRAVILRYHWSRNHAHYVFIDGHTKHFIKAWNTGEGKTTRFSKKRLRRYIDYTNKLATREPGCADVAHGFVIL